MPKRWRSFGIYLLQSLLKRLDGSAYIPEKHEVEQYMYRYLTCPDCVAAGECQHSDCRCKMPERAHVKTDICPALKWGPFKDKASWEKEEIDFYYKKKEHVKK